MISQGDYVWQYNAAAADLGVTDGMSINQMQLMTRHRHHIARDRTHEERALLEIATWASQFTPDIVLFAEDALMLEVGRSLRLFKSAEAIQGSAYAGLKEMGLDCQLGLANTPKAAYLLSLNAAPINHKLGHAAVLNTPLDQLQISEQTITELLRCGFETLNDLTPINEPELARRFGPDFLNYLQELHGRTPDPQKYLKPPPVFQVATDFAQPISNSTWIAEHQLDMISSLIEFCRTRNLIYQHMHWSIELENNQQRVETTIELNAKGLITLNDEEHRKALHELVKLKFDTYELQSQIIGIALSCRAFMPLSLLSQDLFSDDSHDQEFSDLKNRLTAKLGHQAIVQLETRPDIAPEDSYEIVAQSKEAPHENTSDLADQRAEPVWIFDRPKPLSVKNGKPQYRGDLEFIHGANRMVTQWWAQLKSRDYYIARQDDGQLLWIYFDRVSKKWFLHGLFG